MFVWAFGSDAYILTACVAFQPRGILFTGYIDSYLAFSGAALCLLLDSANSARKSLPSILSLSGDLMVGDDYFSKVA